MGNLKKVRITIERIELSADMYFKILRCIKKHEPEIWKEIKEVLIEDMDGAAANIGTSGNSLHNHFVSASLLEGSWNFAQDFKKSKEYDRLINDRGVTEESAIITANAVYDFIRNAR